MIETKNYNRLVEADIRNLLKKETELYLKASYNFGFVNEKLHFCAESGGKMFRPYLLLLLNEALGGKPEKALPIASSIQIFHNFSLVHDDIEDNDLLRRGRSTAWSLWGVPQGINIGDFILNLSYKSAIRVEDKFLRKALDMISGCFEEVINGQQLDMSFEDLAIDSVSESDYLEMITGKSAALVSLSCSMGAFLAEKEPLIVKEASEFGLNLGLAYQIFDDYMGLWGSEAKTGKKTASDIYKKKKTYPVLLGARIAASNEKEKLRAIYKKDSISENDAKEAVRIFEDTGVKNKTVEAFEALQAKALASLRILNLEKEWSEYFVSIINKLMRI